VVGLAMSAKKVRRTIPTRRGTSFISDKNLVA